MYGYAYINSFKKSAGSQTPYPLTLNPTFWFDYSLYPIGALAGGELDRTGNYSITPLNGALVNTDGTNNALSTNGATSTHAVSYGSTFTTEFQQSHTHAIIYAPKVISRTFDVITGVDDGLGMQYAISHFGQKIRLFIKIGGVNNIFDTTNNVFLTTDPLFILIEVKQGGIVMLINGVIQPLTNSAFTSTLTNLNIVGDNLYTGARNNNGAIDSPTNCFLGQHLLFPALLTPTEKTNLLNYFV